MIRRCTKPSTANYCNYGGRGIKVSKSWMRFENFYKDMGDRPDGCSIERINNEKGYTKSNCKWATSLAQGSNKRNNFIIIYRNKSYSLASFSRKIGINRVTIKSRLRLGWTIDDVVKIKPIAGNRHARIKRKPYARK